MVMDRKLLWHYSWLGWHVFPLHTPTGKGCSCGQVPCRNAGKHPRTHHGLKDATADMIEIGRWWDRWPEANAAIATEPSGLVVIDLDVKGSGLGRWADLAQQLGIEEPLMARTGSGGRHLFYKAPAEPISSRAAALGSGIDVRARGGYVVAPPSLHRSGQRYTWLSDLREPDPLPVALRELLLRRGPPLPAPSAPPEGTIPEGQRNATLFRRAGSMRWAGMEEEAILAALHVENKRCRPPLGEDELRQLARGVMRYPVGSGDQSIDRRGRPSSAARPRCPLNRHPVTRGQGGPPRTDGPYAGMTGGGGNAAVAGEGGDASPADGPRLTDQGNAQRLVARHGQDLRYCHAWACWLVWTGKRWRRDGDGEVMRRAKETVAAILQEAQTLPEGDERRALLKHAVRSESEARLKAMIALAQSEPGIPVAPEDLDADPLLLCCPNGTLDLRTGTLRPHRREDLLTRVVSAPFDPDARAPRWDAFLQRVLAGDTALIGYLQQAAGYSLTGLTGEETLFFLHGSGRNGKSRFLGALRHVLGEYGRTTRPETVMARERSCIPNDIAALAGARMVITTEIEDGTRIAESLIKQLTGGDTVSARFLHAEFFEFLPQFKLWLAANHRPRIHGTDHAIWERIQVIPFTVTIPPEERDRDLATKLDAEKAGILRWMVEGCLAWQREGLSPPAVVQQATGSYRQEMDVLAGFLEDRCVRTDGGSVLAAQLYAACQDWCAANGERPWTQRTLGMKLRERGFESGRTPGGHARIWHGLGLREAV
jgi:putative DNA primase/helicase